LTKTFRLSALLLALLASAAGHAAGLGKLAVKSGLGQPLRAEIELLSVRADELASMEARLAASELFGQARIERGSVHDSLRFSIEKRADGTPFLRIVSLAPINEPVLDVLVELSWNAGRLVRDYTILLDLPGRPVLAPPSVLTAPAAASATSVAAPVAPARPAAPQQYGPVKPGETLHGIASKLRHEDVTLDMMAAGLYQANRDAFANDNMNQLVRGRMLKVPDVDTVMRQFSPDQASRLRREHAVAWEAYRARLADQAAQRVLPDAARPDAGRIETSPRPLAPADAAAAQDVLRLSRGEVGKTADSQALQRIQTLEEELLARGRALEEATGRVTQLERTVQDLQRLMVLQGGGASDAPSDATSPVPVDPPATPAAQAPVTVRAPVTPTAPESDWLSEYLQSPLRLVGIGLAVLLLGALVILNVRKKRQPKVAMPIAQPEAAAAVPFRAAVFRPGSPGGDAGPKTEGPMTELSRLGLGAIDTNEVDPLAEADVYMAYGRDMQAEEILKAAGQRDPARHEIQLKLLEIYAGRLDKAAFEECARALRASLGDQPGAIWFKVVEMGRMLDPGNLLYTLQANHVSPAPEMPEEVVPVAPAATTDNTIEFELPELPAAPTPAAPALDLSGIDLDLNTPPVSESPPPVDQSEPPAGAGGERVTIKFDLAKAYLEMGEVEGALEILREVVVEGDAQQRAEAQALLDTHS